MGILRIIGVPPPIQVRASARQVEEVRKVFIHIQTQKSNEQSQAFISQEQGAEGEVHMS